MKKNWKILVVNSICLISLFSTIPAYAGRWQKGNGKNSNKWWYNHQDGTYPKSTWAWIDSNDDGLAESYYFDANGWLKTNTTVEGYKVDGNGAWTKDGVVQQKAISDGGVFTNGKSESSSGTIDYMGSDLDLGTEISDKEKQKPVVEKKNTVSSKSNSKDEKKSGQDVIDVAGNYAGPSVEGDSNLATEKTTKNKAENFSGNVGNSTADLKKSESTELISYARSFIAVLPYKVAGTSLSSGVDCSGFTQEVFKKFGISIPRDSRSQYASATKVSAEELQPGDLVFYGSSPSTIYHVGIYSGNGTIIHSTRTGDFVREHDVFYKKPYGYGRYTK